MTTGVYIVENHDVVREVVASYLARMEGVVVCGQADSAERALPDIARLRPDVVLIDLSLPGMSGLDLLRELSARHPDVACVVLTGHAEPGYRDRALAAGARAFVLKDDPANLETALRSLQ